MTFASAILIPMTTRTSTPKTDRQRFYEKMTPRFNAYFRSGREDAFVEGLKAFAQEWFSEHEDEQNLPQAWWDLARLTDVFCWDAVEAIVDPDDGDDDE